MKQIIFEKQIPTTLICIDDLPEMSGTGTVVAKDKYDGVLVLSRIGSKSGDRSEYQWIRFGDSFNRWHNDPFLTYKGAIEYLKSHHQPQSLKFFWVEGKEILDLF